MTEQPLNRHQRRRLRTKKQLEQAAKECLLENGYDALTIQDIVDRADLGRGTFYLHFHDKEEIVWAIFQGDLQQISDLDQQKSADQPGQASLLTSFRNFFRHAAEHRSLYTIMLGSQGSTALTARVQNWLAASFEDELASQISTNSSSPLPPPILSQMLTGAFTRLILWWLEVPNPYTPDAMAQMAFQGFINGINGNSNPSETQ